MTQARCQMSPKPYIISFFTKFDEISTIIQSHPWGTQGLHNCPATQQAGGRPGIWTRVHWIPALCALYHACLLSAPVERTTKSSLEPPPFHSRCAPHSGRLHFPSQALSGIFSFTSRKDLFYSEFLKTQRADLGLVRSPGPRMTTMSILQISKNASKTSHVLTESVGC